MTITTLDSIWNQPWELLYFWVFFDVAWSVDVLACGKWKRLRKASIYRSLGWVSDTWRSLIGDTCHNLVRGDLRLFLQETWHHLIGRNVLIFKVIHVSAQLDCLCHCLHAPMCDWYFVCFLCFYFNDTWQISIGFWIVIVETSCSTWCFVIGQTLWT